MTNTASERVVSLTTNLDHQLEQAPELRKLAYEVIVTEGLRDLTMAQRIALTMFYRSLQTHEEIEILLKQKLVEDALLAEVERYARRVTMGKGGTLSQWLSQSPTDKYPMTEVSTTNAIRVWRNLTSFSGLSKFSVWVYRIAQNAEKDLCAGVIKRGEVGFLEWKDLRTVRPGQEDTPFFPRGLTPIEIGNKFGKNPKWASNQLERIKKTLKRANDDQAKSASRSVLDMNATDESGDPELAA